MAIPLSSRPTDGAAPSAGARRMALYRDRRRKGLRCVTVEILGADIDMLIRRGHLARDRRGDLVAVRDALHALLDDMLR
jgi:hypothetical protein